MPNQIVFLTKKNLHFYLKQFLLWSAYYIIQE